LAAEAGFTGARDNLGTLLAKLGRPDDAMKQYTEAMRLDPGDWHAPFLAGKLLLELGRDVEALPCLRQAVRLDPDNPSTLLFTSHVLASDQDARVRDGKSAFLLAQKANALTGGQQPAMIDAIAMSLAELGRFDDARTAAQDALALAERFGMTNDVPLIARRLDLYRNNQPYRQSFTNAPPRPVKIQ